MVRKKNTRKTSFGEIMGFSNIFQNDIFNFIFGIVILLLSVFLVIAFISYIISGQNDQSIILDLKPGEWSNSDRTFHNSCGSLGAFAAYFFIWAFSITDWEDTPWYNCINNLGVALWLNYFIALAMSICLWRKGGKR